MGRLPELVKGYSLEDVLNRDEMGLDTATERICRKGEKRKRWKTKFVAANSSKVCDPIVVWRSKKPCCFRKLKSIYHSHGVHYFTNAKAWMTTEIMQEILKMLDKKMIAQGRNVLHFLDSASSHLHILQERLENIKLEFLPQNSMSRLQPWDAGLIRNFKHKYRKLLIHYILAHITQ